MNFKEISGFFQIPGKSGDSRFLQILQLKAGNIFHSISGDVFFMGFSPTTETWSTSWVASDQPIRKRGVGNMGLVSPEFSARGAPKERSIFQKPSIFQWANCCQFVSFRLLIFIFFREKKLLADSYQRK